MSRSVSTHRRAGGKTCEDAIFLVIRHLERAPVDHLGIVEQGVRTCREAGIPVCLLVRTVAVGLAVRCAAAADRRGFRLGRKSLPCWKYQLSLDSLGMMNCSASGGLP